MITSALYHSEFSLILWLLVYLFIFLVVLASLCKVYSKAGQAWWAALIPIYNLYILLKIVCKPAWWLILYIIPVVNVIIGVVITYNLALRFGKGIAGAHTAPCHILPNSRLR